MKVGDRVRGAGRWEQIHGYLGTIVADRSGKRQKMYDVLFDDDMGEALQMGHTSNTIEGV